MPRRGGKAAGRRSRQRPPRRPVTRQPELGRQIPIPERDARDEDEAIAGVPPAGAPPMLEAPGPEPPRPAPLPPIYAGSSRLSERAAAEYGYVTRDLRNIAVLTAIIVVLLAIATIVFPSLGLISR